MFEDAIIKKIIEAWILDQAHPLRERVQSPLPPFNHIKALVETAFLAGLERVEDRPIRFALVIVELDAGKEWEKAGKTSEYLLHLVNPLPLSVDSIVKLAPALDPSISAMAVGPSDKKDELCIWGIFTFSPISHPFSEIPQWVYGELGYRPDFFTVYVNNAGSLLISRHHNQIGRVLNGEFMAATPSPFTLKSLGRHMVEAIKNHQLYTAFGEVYWRVYRDVIELLLSEAGSRGHGSIFILLKPDDLEEGVYVPRFGFHEKIGVCGLLDRLLQNDLDVPTSIAVRKTVAERIKFLAQLGTIDGAVMLTNKLDLVSFGAMLSAPPWTGAVISGPDGFGEGGGELLDTSRLGMRHSSGIAFAGACENSFVFVISQDGPVRVFMKRDEDTILYWPDCCSASMSV